jgi:hypothetical protein
MLKWTGGTELSNWIVATSLAIGCGIVYLALRPPLYDFDGYMFRLYALLPSRFSNSNPHHLLWNSVQILLSACAASLGQPNTVPFQIFGILINCLTLFATYRLLLAVGKSRGIAIAGVIFTAFSPAFWYVGLQNHPYPLAFLAIVIYLTAWHKEDGSPPEGLRLCVAGLSLALSILFHEGVIVLLPVATCLLIVYGRGKLWQKLMNALEGVECRLKGMRDRRRYAGRHKSDGTAGFIAPGSSGSRAGSSASFARYRERRVR